MTNSENFKKLLSDEKSDFLTKEEDKVQVVFCPCGKMLRRAGRPNPKPSLTEKREMGENVADGCKIDIITIAEYRAAKYNMCFETSKETCADAQTEEE